MDMKVLVATVLGVLATVVSVMNKYQTWITWIMLRVEKDSADGTWTAEEKEQEAIDLYNEQIKPSIPAAYWFVKLIPSAWVNALIRAAIKKICKDASKLQGTNHP